MSNFGAGFADIAVVSYRLRVLHCGEESWAATGMVLVTSLAFFLLYFIVLFALFTVGPSTNHSSPLQQDSITVARHFSDACPAESRRLWPCMKSSWQVHLRLFAPCTFAILREDQPIF